MLSRTAQNLYWLARYVERADSMARLIGMGSRMVILPNSVPEDDWRSVALASGAVFAGEVPCDVESIASELILSEENPSSIASCLMRARENGRAVRVALTMDLWEALNDGWRYLAGVPRARAVDELPRLLDWTRKQCARIHGAIETTLLRHAGYHFLNIGGRLERADMTLRLLDVKYFVLLPETEVVGGGHDHSQWLGILHATSARRAFHWSYRGDHSPWKIADFLILNRLFPRSVACCYADVADHLDELGRMYGQRHRCHGTASEMVAMLEDMQMGEIFQVGLHEFVEDAIKRTNRLSAEIHTAYHF